MKTSIETDREAAIVTRGLTRSYPGMIALDNVDLVVRPGEVRGLAGANGAGKSTLIKILAGVEQPSAGEFSVAGLTHAEFRSPRDSLAAGVAVVHQELPLLSNLDASENVTLGTDGRGLLRPRGRRRSQAIYEKESTAFDDAPAGTAIVSGLAFSSWQLIALIRALSMRARVLILDEPTSSLNVAERSELHEVVRSVASRGVAVLYVSHFLDDILEMCDTVTVLRSGKVVSDTRADELTTMSLLAHMTGIAPDNLAVKGRTQLGADVLAAGDDRTLVVQNLATSSVGPISFRAPAGAVTGIYGLEGAGGAEVLEALFGSKRSDGTVTLRGKRITGSIDRRMAAGLGYVNGHRRSAIVPEWSVRLNHALPGTSRRKWWSYPSPKFGKSSTDRTIEDFDVRGRPDSRMLALSGGNQQKLLLGRWLQLGVDCLLVDEPSHGVDAHGRRAIHQKLRVAAGEDRVILVSSTDPEEMVDLCDRVIVIANGLAIDELAGPALTVDNLEWLTRRSQASDPATALETPENNHG